MKYGIYGNNCKRLATSKNDAGLSFAFTLAPLLFDSATEAAMVLVGLTEKQYPYEVQIVGVKETPATTRREMVELSGTVDLTGLSFAVYYPGLDRFLGTYKTSPGRFNRAGRLNGETFPALVFPSQGKMIDKLLTIRKTWGGFSTVPARVVGIRTVEVPGETEIVFF